MNEYLKLFVESRWLKLEELKDTDHKLHSMPSLYKIYRNLKNIRKIGTCNTVQ